jgi:hypothetical protein
LPSRAPSKNVALTVSWMGTGLLAVWDIARFLLQDFGRAITLAGRRHPAERCGPGEGGATMRSIRSARI